MSSVVLDDDPKLDPQVFRETLGTSVTVAPIDTTESFRAAVREHGARAAVATGGVDVTRDLLAGLNSLAVYGQASIGLDNVDLDVAADLGITVTHAPDYCVDEVATHTLALFLACVRDVPAHDQRVRDGMWSEWAGRELHRLRGDTVGLVAFGDIARAVADRLQGFGLDVVAYDPYVDAETMHEHGVAKVGVDGLCDAADHLSVHAPLTDATRGLVDDAWLDALPVRGVVVNTGRGGVVDEDALRAALDDGAIAAAGLDVFETEPPVGSPLRGRDDVVTTPHMGWYSAEARAEANETVAHDVARVLAGEEPAHAVGPAEW